MNDEAIKLINWKYEKRIVEEVDWNLITLETIRYYDDKWDKINNTFASWWLYNKTYNWHILKWNELNVWDIIYIMDEKYDYNKHVKMVFMVTDIMAKKIELMNLNNYTGLYIDKNSDLYYDRLYDAYDRIITIENIKI